MKIEILSETITNEDLLEQLNLQNSEIEFNLVDLPKDTRPLDPNLIIAVVQSLGIGSVIIAVINAIKDVKITKMDLEAKKEDICIENKRLDMNYEIEMAKIKAEKEKIILQGYIEIIAKQHEKLINEEKVEEVLKLKNIGIVFDKENVRIPLSMNKEIINQIGLLLNETSIEKIAHYKG